MNKYHLVVGKRENKHPTQDNEIRVTNTGGIGRFINYGIKLIQGEKQTLVIKAMGQTIKIGIVVAEILKRRVAGLHQITEFSSVEVVDVYEPIEEGLDRVQISRLIPSVVITLSLLPLDTTNAGYQEPIPPEIFASLSERPRAPRRNQRRRSDRPRSNRVESKKEERTESKQNGNRPNTQGNRGSNAPRSQNNQRPRRNSRKFQNHNRQTGNLNQPKKNN